MSATVKIIECPRDAWQGLAEIIPADEKAEYHHLLAKCGFRHIDAVSFVSPKYVPQMADSETVMARLAADEARLAGVEIIGIVVNEKGLDRALATPGVTTVGYPHSLSPTFLQSNSHMTIEQSRAMVERLARATSAAGRGLVIYMSMAFGNPYEDPWSAEQVAEELLWLEKTGVSSVSLADTAGVAQPEDVSRLLHATFRTSGVGSGATEVGVHLHSRPEQAAKNITAAYQAGCRRFDSALTGLGGCPFAGDELVGNIPTEIVLPTLERLGAYTDIPAEALERALAATRELRGRYVQA